MEKKNSLKARKVDLCICIKDRGKILDLLLNNIEQITKIIDCNIIFIDGSSSDNTTEALIEYYKEHKDNCTIRQIKSNETYIDAYNMAIENTVSDYICWLDSDDISDDNRVAIQAKYLDEHNDVDVVSCSTYLSETQAISNTLVELNNEQITKGLNDGVSMKEICHFQSCMFRRKCLEKFKNGIYFYPEFVGGYAGEGFLYVLHFNGYKFANIASTYYVYTKGKYAGSLTNTIEPLFMYDLDEKPYAEKKKEIMKYFRKYNKKQENKE